MNEESVTKSESRTYVVAIYDVVCPNEVRFIKVVLPESYQNNSAWAKQYYRNSIPDLTLATRILACVSVENYMETLDEVWVDKLQPTKENMLDSGSRQDLEMVEEVFGGLEAVVTMLDHWNSQQKLPNTTYSAIVRSMLRRLNSQSKVIEAFKTILKEFEKKD
jgi:hypothetical protein